MTNPQALEARIIDLEIRIAENERTIDDLSNALIDLGKKTGTYARQISRLNEQVAALESDDETGQPDNQPPPHY